MKKVVSDHNMTLVLESYAPWKAKYSFVHVDWVVDFHSFITFHCQTKKQKDKTKVIKRRNVTNVEDNKCKSYNFHK